MTIARCILVATDFSEPSGHAVQYAAELCAKLGARLVLVHAYGLPAYVMPIEGSMMASPQYAADLVVRLQDQLDAEVAKLASRGIAIETKLVLGPAYLEIVRVAQECGADLIVVGTHGRSGLSHAIMGSVAERVVRLSPTPVLSVR
ncbi:MAG TPA: universal stress protein [Polyangiales bacterium]